MESSYINKVCFLSFLLLKYLRDCMLHRLIPWNIHICMYNRQNIDPRYLGLYVHLEVLECSKHNRYLGQIWVCVEGSMGPYYWKHRTRTLIKEATTPRVFVGSWFSGCYEEYLISFQYVFSMVVTRQLVTGSGSGSGEDRQEVSAAPETIGQMRPARWMTRSGRSCMMRLLLYSDSFTGDVWVYQDHHGWVLWRALCNPCGGGCRSSYCSCISGMGRSQSGFSVSGLW